MHSLSLYNTHNAIVVMITNPCYCLSLFGFVIFSSARFFFLRSLFRSNLILCCSVSHSTRGHECGWPTYLLFDGAALARLRGWDSPPASSLQRLPANGLHYWLHCTPNSVAITEQTIVHCSEDPLPTTTTTLTIYTN